MTILKLLTVDKKASSPEFAKDFEQGYLIKVINKLRYIATITLLLSNVNLTEFYPNF
jgi:hypothetical protein